MAGLTDTLELDLTEALRGIDTVEGALTSATQTFKVGIVDALSVLSQVEVTADAGPVTAAVDAALAAAETTVPLDADAAAIESAIDAAVAGVDAEVPVEVAPGDLAAMTSDIAGAVGDADTTVAVDADTAAAEAAVNDLGSAADVTADAITGVSLGSRELAVAAGLAAGEVGKLTEALPESSTFQAVAVGLATIAAGATASFRAAEEAEVADRRFASTLGDLAESVDRVNVGGLTGDLTSLATQAGSSDERLKLAVARVAELGAAAGAADPVIVSTAQNIEALALRAAVANPTLGEAGDIADRLTNAFLRGGRALTPFGIALQASEIQARALADTGKATAAELTVFDKQAAGAALAVEQLGDRLGTDFQQGIEQTQIGLRSVRQEFDNALEVIGRPLLAPVLAEMRDAEPVLVGFADVFADLAEQVLPLAGTAIEALVPALGGLAAAGHVVADVFGIVGTILDAVPDPVLEGVAAFLIYNRLLGELAGLARTAAAATGLYTAVETQAAAAAQADAIATGEATAAKLAYAGASGVASSAAGALGAGVSALVSPVGLLAAGLAIGTIALSNHRKEQEETRRHVEELTKAFEDQSTSFQEDIDSLVSNRFSGLTKNLRDLGLGFEDLEEFATRGDQGVIDFVRHLEESGQASEGVGDAFEKAREKGRTFGQAYNIATLKGREFDKGAKEVILTLGKVQKSAQDAADKTLLAALADRKFTDEALRAAEANHRLSDGDVDHVAVLRQLLPDQAKEADALNETAAAAAEAAKASDDLVERFVELTVQQDALLRGVDLVGPGLVDLTRKFADGSLTTDDFRQALDNTGLTSDELLDALVAGRTALEAYDKSMGDDLTRTLEEVGPKFGAVADAAIHGKLTHEQFLAVIARTGIPADQLQGALDTARDAVNRFADDVAGKLPDVQDAFTELGKQPGMDDFVSKVERQADDLASHKGLADFAEGVKRDLRDLAAQPGGLDAFLRKTDAGARALGNKPGLDAFVRKVKRQAQDLGQLPGLESFIAKVEKQAADLAAFTANVANIARRGATDLAAALLEQGPNAASATVAAQAARLGDSALAARERQLRKAEASEAKSQQTLRDLAVVQGERMAGIQTTSNELLSKLPGPDLTKPYVDAAQRAAASLRHEEERLARQAAAAAGAAVSDAGVGVLGRAFSSGQQLGRELSTGIVVGIETDRRIAEALSTTVKSAAEGVGAARATVRSSGQQLARELLVGVEEGVDSSADELFRAGERAAGAVDAGMRSRLEINSPSRVGALRGSQYNDGVAVGLSDTGQIDRAMSVVAGRVARPLVGVASVSVAPVAPVAGVAAGGAAAAGGFGAGSPLDDGRLVAETAAMRAQGLETLVLLRRLVDTAGGIGDATADAIRRTGSDGRFLPAAMRG